MIQFCLCFDEIT